MKLTKITNIKLTKATRLVLIGVVTGFVVLSSIGVGLGIGSSVFGSSTSSTPNTPNTPSTPNTPGTSCTPSTNESRPWGALEILPNTGKLPVVFVTAGEDINDKAFNQQVYDGFAKIDSPNLKYGLPEAIYGKDSTKYYVKVSSKESADLVAGYTTALASLGTSISISGGDIMKKVIIAPGNEHVNGIKEFQENNPNDDTKFVLLDGPPVWYDLVQQKIDRLKNVYGIQFNVKQSAFQAGYLTGLYLEAKGYDSPKVGVFGEDDKRHITNFMTGFVTGIKFYNDNNGENKADVQFVKFDTDDEYTSSTSDVRSRADTLIDGGAHVILLSPKEQTKILIDAINGSNRKDEVKIVGVNLDQAKYYSQYADKFITSARKNYRRALIEGYKAAIGFPNAIETILKYSDTNSYEYNLGLVGNFTNYVEQFDDNMIIEGSIDSVTWGSLYDKVNFLSSTNINYFQVNEKNLRNAYWSDALAYIKDN